LIPDKPSQRLAKLEFAATNSCHLTPNKTDRHTNTHTHTHTHGGIRSFTQDLLPKTHMFPSDSSLPPKVFPFCTLPCSSDCVCGCIDFVLLPHNKINEKIELINKYFVLRQLQELCSLVCPAHILSYEQLTLYLMSK